MLYRRRGRHVDRGVARVLVVHVAPRRLLPDAGAELSGRVTPAPAPGPDAVMRPGAQIDGERDRDARDPRGGRVGPRGPRGRVRGVRVRIGRLVFGVGPDFGRRGRGSQLMPAGTRALAAVGDDCEEKEECGAGCGDSRYGSGLERRG